MVKFASSTEDTPTTDKSLKSLSIRSAIPTLDPEVSNPLCAQQKKPTKAFSDQHDEEDEFVMIPSDKEAFGGQNVDAGKELPTSAIDRVMRIGDEVEAKEKKSAEAGSDGKGAAGIGLNPQPNNPSFPTFPHTSGSKLGDPSKVSTSQRRDLEAVLAEKSQSPEDKVSPAMRPFSKPDKCPSMQRPGFKDEAASASKVSIPELSKVATSTNSKLLSTEAATPKNVSPDSWVHLSPKVQEVLAQAREKRLNAEAKTTNFKADSKSLATRYKVEDTAFKPTIYFFYGTLMDAQTLHKVLALPCEPTMIPATIMGYKRMQWKHFPALFSSANDNAVQGFAYKIQTEAQYKRLDYYGGRHWRPVKYQIHLEDGMLVTGSCFMWGLEDESE